MKKRQIAGQLFWRDDSYLLVDPDPLIERRSWMTDNMKEFVVCQENGVKFNLIVTPPFAISYRRMGELVEVQELEIVQEQDAETYAFEAPFEPISADNFEELFDTANISAD